MSREPLFVMVTTSNNAATLDASLDAVAWAEDIGAAFHTQPFAGYSAQKQAASSWPATRGCVARRLLAWRLWNPSRCATQNPCAHARKTEAIIY